MEELQITVPEIEDDFIIDFKNLKEGQLFYFDEYSHSFSKFIRIDDNIIYYITYDYRNLELFEDSYKFTTFEELNLKISLIKDDSIIENFEKSLKFYDFCEILINLKKSDIKIQKLKILENKYSNIIKNFEDVIKHHFTSDNYEIKLEEDIINIYLKYNDITITNSEGKSHFIKSIFINIKFNTTYNRFQNELFGFRGELSPKELISGYSHSHLKSNITSWSRFCLGSSEITGILVDLSSNDFNDAKFDLLLCNLEEYIKWESLEGGPYIKISNLAYGSTNNVPLATTDEVSEIFEEFLENKFVFNTKFDCSLKKIKIVNDSLLVNALTTICPSQFKGIYTNGVFVKSLNFENIINRSNNVLNDIHKFKFKDENYPILYGIDELKNINQTEVPDNRLVNKIIEKLENQINNHFLQKLT